jgi:hypothetical protein
VYLGRPQQRFRWRLAQGLAAALVTLYAVALAMPARPGPVAGTGLAATARGQAASTVPDPIRPLPEAHRVAPAADPTTPPPPRAVPDRPVGPATGGTPVPGHTAAPTVAAPARVSGVTRHTRIGRLAPSAR